MKKKSLRVLILIVIVISFISLQFIVKAKNTEELHLPCGLVIEACEGDGFRYSCGLQNSNTGEYCGFIDEYGKYHCIEYVTDCVHIGN